MIKQLREENLDEIMMIIENVIIELNNQGIDQWDEIYPDIDVIKRDLNKKNAYGYFEKNELVGYVAINEEYPDEYNEIKWVINKPKFLITHRLCINPGKQGKGIAKQLISFTEKYAKDNNHSSIRLDAFSKNPNALQLYENLGYQKAGCVQFRKGLFFCYEKGL